MDDDIQRINNIAVSVLANSEDNDKLTQAAELLKLVAETENQRAQTKKIEDDLQDSIRHKKIRDTKDFIALLAPVLTTIVLAGTLALQSFQFSRTEKDKDIEAQRQRDAALAQAKREAQATEDASWADALRLLQSSEHLSPAAVLLKRFSRSARYAEEAKRTAVQLLEQNITAPSDFENLFGSVFEPATWENLPQIADIDRHLYQKINPILSTLWTFKSNSWHEEKLTPSNQNLYNCLKEELSYISAVMAILLKTPRPPSQALDFHSIALWNTDLKGVDLRGADISEASLSFLNVKGADLSGITKFGGNSIEHVAWWEASKIGPEFGSYLRTHFPVDVLNMYTVGQKFSIPEYEKELLRLGLAQK